MSLPFLVLTPDQRTDAWRQARAGRLTGSRAGDMLAVTKKGEEAARRRDLRLQLVLERITGAPQEAGFVSADMQRGTELESEAFSQYEALTGNLVRRVGFLAHTDLLTGTSPDGVVGAYEGLVELKCPKSTTHLAYLRSGQVADDYVKQCQHALWITGAAWCDFVSYDPRFPDNLRLRMTRITMTDADRKAYELLVRMFLGEVDREFEAVLKLASEVAA